MQQHAAAECVWFMALQAALVEENGVNLYRERCKTLSIFPLSEVIAVLGQESADLSHCYMGALGVHAFAHALACNTIIEELVLRTNGLTDQVRPCSMSARVWDNLVIMQQLLDCWRNLPAGKHPVSQNAEPVNGLLRS